MSEQSVTQLVVDTLHYMKKFTGTSVLIKLGGSILDDADLVKQLCDDLTLLRAAGVSIVIVHGGSKAINHALNAYQVDTHFHQGLRVTCQATMDVVEMVLCGRVNQLLVRTLNALGMSAVGLSGSDGHMLVCKAMEEVYGQVGDIEAVNTTLLDHFLMTQASFSKGIIPVISPVGVDGQGKALNVNADWAASCIASALKINKLIYLTDQEGIWDAQGKLISELDSQDLQELIDTGVVKDGMLTKVKTVIRALEQGIDDVHIISAKRPHALIEEMFTHQGIGTVCKRSKAMPRPSSSMLVGFAES